MCEKNRGGAPQGNLNNFIHGGRSSRPSLALGAWGKRYGNVRAQASRYRRRLTNACRERHGVVSVRHEELILHAARLEMAARVIQKILGDGADTLPAGEQAGLVKQVVLYSSQRELAVRKLDLSDDKPTSEWDEIDRMGLEGVQGDDLSDPDDDTDLDTPDDCEAANGVLGDAEGRGSIWDEIDQEIAADRETNGDGGNQS